MTSKRIRIIVLGVIVVLCISALPGTAAALQATLTWTASAAGVTARVERATVSTGPWVSQGTLAAGITTFNQTGLVLGTQYCYRVVEYNSFGDGPASSAACGTPNTPAGSTNLTVIFAP